MSWAITISNKISTVYRKIFTSFSKITEFSASNWWLRKIRGWCNFSTWETDENGARRSSVPNHRRKNVAPKYCIWWRTAKDSQDSRRTKNRGPKFKTSCWNIDQFTIRWDNLESFHLLPCALRNVVVVLPAVVDEGHRDTRWRNVPWWISSDSCFYRMENLLLRLLFTVRRSILC